MEEDYTHIAKQVINTEAKSLLGLTDSIDQNFNKAISLLMNLKGKVIVTGIGKSGHIGRKIAASFASTGTSSFFLHPSEAIHGDLGMISNKDLVLAIANSGETAEIVSLLPFLNDHKIPLIAISSKPNSTLAQKATAHLNTGSFEEACPFNLSPTTSSTLTLVMGDALMVALMNARGFDEENYAKLHPGGSLGKRMLEHVRDIMKTDNLPLISEDATMSEVVYTINSGRCGLGIVGNLKNVKGIITDGDLRRAMDITKEKFFEATVTAVMTKAPKFIAKDTKLIDAKNTMNTYKITSLLVGSALNLKRIIQLHDINL